MRKATGTFTVDMSPENGSSESFINIMRLAKSFQGDLSSPNEWSQLIGEAEHRRTSGGKAGGVHYTLASQVCYYP